MCKRFVLEAYSSFLRISAHSMVVCTNMKTIPLSILSNKQEPPFRHPVIRQPYQ